jgi:hypothetical protein
MTKGKEQRRALAAGVMNCGSGDSPPPLLNSLPGQRPITEAGAGLIRAKGRPYIGKEARRWEIMHLAIMEALKGKTSHWMKKVNDL